MDHVVVYDSLNIIFNDINLLDYLHKENEYLRRIVKLRKQLNWKKKVYVRLFYSIEDMGNFIKQKLPHWVIGTCINNTILLLDYSAWKNKKFNSLCQILTHEFTHIAINSLTKGKCPIWLNEGLAVYMANQVDSKYYNVKIDNVYDLNYNSRNFYDLCGSAVNKLIEKYGVDSVLERMCYVDDYENDNIFCNINIKNL